ncbi:AraC family transcriptional regulator [Psychromonas sp.]|nr:AraC family transcriptional regulator [Psychromonas sp.]
MLNRSNHKDPLSIMLSTLHLDVEISMNAQFCGSWLLGHKTGEKSFHLISHGECLLAIDGQSPETLYSGDIVIFMRKVRHQLHPIEAVQAPEERQDYLQGVNNSATGILCGSFSYENTKTESLMRALPPVLVIKNDPHAQAWITPLITLIQLESSTPRLGSDILIQQFTESLIIQAVRSYINAGDFEVGILKLIADPKLTKALQAIQNEPQFAWTVDLLAKECAMSRTAFATHFKETSNWSPMEYVTWWRMQSAWSKLVAKESIAEVSESVGYRSEAAFSRAFKKTFDINPGEVRTSRFI